MCNDGRNVELHTCVRCEGMWCEGLWCEGMWCEGMWCMDDELTTYHKASCSMQVDTYALTHSPPFCVWGW